MARPRRDQDDKPGWVTVALEPVGRRPVTAMTLQNPDGGPRPRRVTGMLYRRWVATLRYYQMWVEDAAGGMTMVDPRTIKPLSKGG
jgi:hypothetical protein